MSHRRDLVLPPIRLDRADPDPAYRQLAGQLAEAVRRGTLDGARLPSTRLLAAALGISRNTVVAAYEELVTCGLIEARRGSGTRVAGSRRACAQTFDTLRVFRDAQFPARTVGIVDPDGAAIYLTY